MRFSLRLTSMTPVLPPQIIARTTTLTRYWINPVNLPWHSVTVPRCLAIGQSCHCKEQRMGRGQLTLRYLYSLLVIAKLFSCREQKSRKCDLPKLYSPSSLSIYLVFNGFRKKSLLNIGYLVWEQFSVFFLTGQMHKLLKVFICLRLDLRPSNAPFVFPQHSFCPAALPFLRSTAPFPAFKPFRWLRTGAHYARPSPSRRAAPTPTQSPPPAEPAAASRPRGSWCRQGGWGGRPPSLPFAAASNGWATVGFGLRLQFTTEQERGIRLTVPRQAQESVGSIWPVRQ